MKFACQVCGKGPQGSYTYVERIGKVWKKIEGKERLVDGVVVAETVASTGTALYKTGDGYFCEEHLRFGERYDDSD